MDTRHTDFGFATDRHRIGRLLEPFAAAYGVCRGSDAAGTSSSRLPAVTSVAVDPAASAATLQRDHLHRLRRARFRWRVVIGLSSWLVVFSTSFSSLAEFVVLVVLFSIGTRSLIDATWIWSHAAWGSSQGAGPEPLSWMDRALVALLRWSCARRYASPQEPKIVMVVEAS